MARLFLWIHEELTVGNHTPLASIFTLWMAASASGPCILTCISFRTQRLLGTKVLNPEMSGLGTEPFSSLWRE